MDLSRQDVTDLHIIVHFERLGDDVRTVELFTDHTAAYRVAVQTDQKVEKCGTVTDDQLFVAVDGAQYLLREVKRIMASLLIGKLGIGREVRKTQALFLCESFYR